MADVIFTEGELEYLRSQRLGRLATEAPDGTLQNSPVGFEVDAEAGVILIRGRDLGNTRKFHNIAANGKAAFVVDDLASVNPWIAALLRGPRYRRGAHRPAAAQLVHEPGGDSPSPAPDHQLGLGPDGKEGSRRTVGQDVP